MSSYGRPGMAESSVESGAADWGGLWADETDEYNNAGGNGGSLSSGDRTFAGVELAEISRMVGVHDDNAEFADSSYDTLSVVKCTVVEQESLLIHVKSKQEPRMTSVAEVEIEQIAELKGLDADTLRTDVEALSQLGVELANSVEFKIEDGVPRLILNLESEKPKTPRPPMPAYDKEAEDNVMNMTRELEPPYVVEMPIRTEFTTKEMVEMRENCRKPNAEQLAAAVTVERETPETARITVEVLTGSRFAYTGRAAVPTNSTLVLVTHLPSIARADMDLAREFYENVVLDLKIHHNNVTGKNTLTLQVEVLAEEEEEKKRL